jgi:hypothetical protein
VVEPPVPTATEPPTPAASSAPACVAAAPCTAAAPAAAVQPPAVDAASTPFTVEWLAAVLPDVSVDEVKLMWHTITRNDGPKTIGNMHGYCFTKWAARGVPDDWSRRMMYAVHMTMTLSIDKPLDIISERFPTLTPDGRGMVREALRQAGICTGSPLAPVSAETIAATSIETLVAAGIPEAIASRLKRID